MTRRSRLAAALSLLVLASPLSAASKVWSPLPGPGGGPVDGLAIDPSNPSTLYATSGQDAYKSTDQGATWTKLVRNGVDLGGGVAVDPGNPSIVLSGYGRSTDGGASWAATGFYYGRPSRFVIPGNVPNLAYAVDDYYLWVSLDGGMSWSNRYAGSTTRALAVSPIDPLTLVVSTTAGVVRSTNGGQTFAPAQLGAFEIVDVTWAGTSLVLAASKQNGVFRSTDGGTSWTPSSAGLPSPVLSAIASVPGQSQLGYVSTDAGLARTTNGGLTWTPAAALASSKRLVARTASELYAAGASGLTLSTDGGASFQPRSSGLGLSKIAALLFDTTSTSTLLAGTTSGVHRSTDSGRTWSPVLAVAGQSFSMLASGGTRLWAGSHGGGVFVSTDGGATWVARNAGLPSTQVGALAATLGDESRALVALDSNGAFRTIDGGSTWSPVQAGLSTGEDVSALSISPTNPVLAFAGTTSGSGGRILRSSDGGMTFATALSSSYGNYLSIAVDPGTPQRILAGSTSSTVRSTDDGATWNGSWYAPSVRSMAFDSASPDHIYFATGYYYTAVGKSVNGGASAYGYTPGLTTSYYADSFAALAVDPSGAHRVLYGGSQGLFEIDDGPMKVDSCAPTTAPSSGGTSIRISGSNLPVSGNVRFVRTNSYYAPAVSFSGGNGQRLDVIMPSTPPGLADIVVSNGTDETVTLPQGLAVVGTLPTISSVSPSAAVGGATLRIYGSGFGPGTVFALDSVTGYGSTYVQVLETTPDHADVQVSGSNAGYYDVVATNPTNLSARLVRGFQLLSVRSTSGFYTLPPCRALDTRLPPFVAIPPRGTFPIALGCGIPTDAVAVAANVTVTEAGGSGTLRVSGEFPVPDPGTVAFQQGLTRANNAILKLTSDYYGAYVNVVNDSDSTIQAIIDVSGYFR